MRSSKLGGIILLFLFFFFQESSKTGLIDKDGGILQGSDVRVWRMEIFDVNIS